MTARVLVKGDRVEVHLGHSMQYATIASVIDEVGARYTVEYSDDEDDNDAFPSAVSQTLHSKC